MHPDQLENPEGVAGRGQPSDTLRRLTEPCLGERRGGRGIVQHLGVLLDSFEALDDEPDRPWQVRTRSHGLIRATELAVLRGLSTLLRGHVADGTTVP